MPVGEGMSFPAISKTTVIKCTNLICQGTFSVISYAFEDTACTKINTATLVPLTGNTPYYCPCCGTNLGKQPVESKKE